MPRLQFGISSYQRARGDLPQLPVVNMFAEQVESEESGIALQSRPGLVDREADMGSGPVDCLIKRDLLQDGALFGVSGGYLYEETTQIGALDGDGPFSMAGYTGDVFINGGESIWVFSGPGFSAISFPDGADVIKILVAASRLIAIRKDTGKFYWSDSLATDIDALDFATAENQPDRLLDMLFIDDTLVLFGKETIEFWPNTGDDELPFQPLEGRVIEKGIRATGCAAQFGSTFAWVTNENQVCMGDENNVLSNPGLQARIEASETVRLFTFLLDGIEFLALRLDTETQVFNRASGTWSEFASNGEDNWIPQCFAGGVFGSAVDGRTAEWGDGHEDFEGVLERRFRAGLPINGGGLRINNLRLRCNVGQTPFLTGDYTDPVVEMRISDDAGQTWDDWDSESLGEQGDYRAQPEWKALGLASQPGFLAEFRVTDPVPWRVSDVLANEPVGGR
jgi:hypothetical protein